MRYRRLAERYARALSAAMSDNSAFEAAVVALDQFAESIRSSQEATNALANPAIDLDARVAVTDTLLQRLDAPSELHKLVSLVVSNGRLAAIGDIATVAGELLDARLNRETVHLTTAAPVSDSDEAYLRERFEKRTGKQITFRKYIDPDVIGGVRARLGDTVIDSTLRNRLKRLRDSLLAQEMN